MSSGKTVTCNRVIDYFVVCGLDESSGLRPHSLGDEEELKTPLEGCYKPKVVSHYPPNVQWNHFDATAVATMCFPRGVRLRTQKHCLDSLFHSFIVTRENGSRFHGFAYTYYEKVTNTAISLALQELQGEHLSEVSHGKSSHLKAPTESLSSRSLPRGFRLGVHVPSGVPSLYDPVRDELYQSYCIAVIMQVPFLHFAKVFLSRLHSYSKAPHTDTPLESYIYHMLYNVTLPSPGGALAVRCLDQMVLLQRPSAEELPLFEYPFRDLLALLGVDGVLTLFTSILLENQVLLYSQDLERLMLVSECVSALLFPFFWQHVYVPILPASMWHFLDAPVPFIMGIHVPAGSSELSMPGGEGNLCAVDIDGSRVDPPEELPSFPHREELLKELSQALTKYGLAAESGKRTSLTKHHRRKYSWNYDSDSGMSSDHSSSEGLAPRHHVSRDQVLKNSETWKKVNELVKRTGIKIEQEGGKFPSSSPPWQHEYLTEMKLNNAIRETFFNRFTHMFSAYEHFIIQPNQDMESWTSNREVYQTFDKAAFLSDQPQQHLPFLSRFIETQMFTTFIDSKILTQWGRSTPNLAFFDKRIKVLRSRYGDSLVRSPGYESCQTIQDTGDLLEKRVKSPNTSVQGSALFIKKSSNQFNFLHLDSSVLNKEPTVVKSSRRSRSKHKDDHDNHSKERKSSKSGRKHQTIESNPSPSVIANTNWMFVETLLKECKNRTKRLLVERLGSEAVELGHGETSLSGVEENTLIAALCDLLERIMGHGRQTRQGKSALWSHLQSYLELEIESGHNKSLDPNVLSPDLSSPEHLPSTERRGSAGEHRRSLERGRRTAHSPEPPSLAPLSCSIEYDVRCVAAMADLKTPIGYARAWVRLALEKKVLYKHLRKLVSNPSLLRNLYKRYAFLRCDEEREQFLFHLLSLNAVDFFCFTNTFTTTVVPYQVVIFPTRKLSASTTTANVWISIAGTLGDTNSISLQKGTLRQILKHQNLGVLTTLRIGHDNSGMSPSWMVDYVLVRNEMTGHTYRFPCGRWLGKGVDDGSLERLLVGEILPFVEPESGNTPCQTPPRCRSPSVSRSGPNPTDVQQMLSDAVNAIVKYHFKAEKERGNLTVLLCGETGLVPALETALLYGFKSSRWLSRNLYLWDYLERCQLAFVSGTPVRDTEVRDTFCKLLTMLNQGSQTMGKDDKFQLLICLLARDRMLHKVIEELGSTRCSPTLQNYEESSFLRSPDRLLFLTSVLEPLADLNISLENSLTKGIG